MIGAVIEFLAVLILIAGAVVLLIALAGAGMAGILLLRFLRVVSRIQRRVGGWFK